MQQLHSTTWQSMQGELLRFVTSKVKDKDLAEDIVQDVFVKVYTNAGQLKDTEKISGWIYQITRNAVADHFRNHARRLEPVNVDWDGSQNDFNDCVAHCLNVLLDSLPDTYRIPLQLAEVENLSQYEIAERLGISYSGARSRVQRARRMLKEKMESLYTIKTDPYGNVILCENKTSCCCNS